MTSSSPAPSRPVLLAGLLALAASAPAWAQAPVSSASPADLPATADTPATDTPASEPQATDTPAPSGDPHQAGEELTIYGDAEVARRRDELDEAIHGFGYKAGKRKGDLTIYRPETPWKPTIVLQDDGLVVLQRSPVRWVAPGRADNPANQLWCIPPFTLMCIRIGGQIVATTKLDYQKGRVMDQIHDPSEAWRSAIANRATMARVDQELPAHLEATWKTGAPLEPSGPTLADPAARRVAILSFWASRADTPEGELVAQVAADFLSLEIQAGPDPVTAEELAAANQQAGSLRHLELPTAASLQPQETPIDPAPPASPTTPSSDRSSDPSSPDADPG